MFIKEHLWGQQRDLRWTPSASGYARCASVDLDFPLDGSSKGSGSSLPGRLVVGDNSRDTTPLGRQRRVIRCCDFSIPAIYTWAVLLVVAGAVLLLHTWSDSAQNISGVGLLACGAFVAVNAQHLVASWRMISEVSRLRNHISFYKTRARKQLHKLRTLIQYDVAIKEMDARFDGSVIVAKHDLPKLKEEVREKLLQNLANVCRLFVAPDPDHLVRAGRELREAMTAFDTILGKQFQDFGQRSRVLLQSLEATRHFHQDGGLSCGMLVALLGDAMLREDIFSIPRHVVETMNTLDNQRRIRATEATEAQE